MCDAADHTESLEFLNNLDKKRGYYLKLIEVDQAEIRYAKEWGEEDTAAHENYKRLRGKLDRLDEKIESILETM